MPETIQRKIVLEESKNAAQIAIGRYTKHGLWSVQNYKRGTKSDVFTMMAKFNRHFVETEQNCETIHLEVDRLSSRHSLCNCEHFN